MKTQYALAFAFATGLSLGLVTIHGLHARATPPVYLVVEIDEITDASAVEALRKTGPANIVEAKYHEVVTSRVRKM